MNKINDKPTKFTYNFTLPEESVNYSKNGITKIEGNVNIVSEEYVADMKIIYYPKYCCEKCLSLGKIVKELSAIFCFGFLFLRFVLVVAVSVAN